MVTLIDSDEHSDIDTVCPVTGLPVIRRKEWSNVPLDDNYWTSVELIGRNILHSIPSGHATGPGAATANELQRAAIAHGIEPGAPYVHISDYSNLDRATLEARRVFATDLRSRSGLTGVVFYKTSPLFMLSIRLGRRFLGLPVAVETLPDYNAAIRRALEILHAHGVKDLPGGRVPASEDHRRESGVLDIDGYHVQYRVLEKHIVLGASSGYLGIEQMRRNIELENMILASMDRSEVAPAMVVDMSNLKGISSAARRTFIANLKRRQEVSPVGLYVCHSVSPKNRAIINLARPFLPVRVRVAHDETEALEIARAGVSAPAKRVGRIQSAFSIAGTRRQGAQRNHIDDFLELMSSIEWEVEGPVDAAWKHPPDHPLAPLVDALELIKADVTELFRTRRQTEAALRASEERYRSILDSIVDGYYEIDFTGRLLFCNDALLRIFGYTRSESLETDAKLLMDDSNRSVAIGTFQKVYESGRPAHTGDWEMLRKDGTSINVEASISLIADQDGTPTGFRGIIRDISRRVRTAREKADLEAQLQRSQRMEAIGTLAGGIAHNFNNLLMGIQGNVSLLQRELPPDSPHLSRLETVEGLVEGGSRLTSQLLGYARAGQVDVRTVDLNSLVVDTAETFGLTRREYRIHTDLTAECLPIAVDAAQIDQALLNLLINAADAMPGGGDITITSRRAPHSELRTDAAHATKGEYAVVSVRDTGCGMDDETMEHIFEPFFTTKGMTGGTGLGLASTYGIIRAHRGFIDVRSTLGGGSTFSFSFPIAGDAPLPEEEAHESPVSGEGTILVVEDDEAVLDACSSMLSMLNYTPICAAGGGEAIEIFRQRHDEIDLVVLDLILADLSGAKVFDAIREIESSARVLLSSGYSIDGEAAGLLERGCDDFIQKPFTIQQISRKLEILLRKTDE
ncbi:MAG: ATP-binding protein [Thermoanaerobaculales bacterium]|nr:ATP-binding protein [Thermoanaerobaculales bacterium]